MQKLLGNVHGFTRSSCNRLFVSFRKMELSSGKLAKFADGSAVVQVKTKKSKNLSSFKISET